MIILSLIWPYLSPSFFLCKKLLPAERKRKRKGKERKGKGKEKEKEKERKGNERKGT